MPTIKEIAEKCGVTKPTVTTKLKELGLWESHVSKSGSAFQVSDEAASAVAAALAKKQDVDVSQSTPKPTSDAAMEVYRDYIDAIKRENEKLWEQIREKEEQLRKKDELIAELSRKLAENQPRQSIWRRLLPGSRN